MQAVAFLDYSPIFAGAERVLYNVISHIDRKKYQPIILFPFPREHHRGYDDLDCEKIYLSDGLKWWMGSDKWKHPLRGTDFLKRNIFGLKIAQIIKSRKIDILDVNLMRADVKMWVWAARKFTNVKIVGHYRSQEQDWVAPGGAQQLFDVVACVSEFSRMRFLLKGEFTRTEVLYDSIDIDKMKSNLSKEEAKIKLGYAPDDLLLISVGQLSLHKGHDNAIRAFAEVVDEFPNAKLLVAGGDRGENFAEYYRKIAADLGVADSVAIPGTQISDIQTVYRAADLTLSLTKVGEGFGLVPYESALLGTPFIAPSFGAICEFVNDGVTGYLVDTNNHDAVVRKIRYLLSHPREAEEAVGRLKSVISEKLQPSVLAQNLDKLYSSL